MYLGVLRAIRDISQKSIKLYAWSAAPAAAVYLQFSPYRGMGDLIKAEAERSGRKPEEVADEVLAILPLIRKPWLKLYLGRSTLAAMTA